MEMPDVTKIQLVAIVQPIISTAIAFGAPITDAQSIALMGLAGALSTVLTLADAHIRNGRSRALSAPEVLDLIRKPQAPAVNE